MSGSTIVVVLMIVMMVVMCGGMIAGGVASFRRRGRDARRARGVASDQP